MVDYYLCTFCHAMSTSDTPHGTDPCPEFLREHDARITEMIAKTALLNAQTAATARNVR